MRHFFAIVALIWQTNVFAQQEEGFLFRETTLQAGIDYNGVSYGMAWGDINGDGYPDLFATGHGIPQLYINRKDGTFLKLDIPYFKKSDTINGQIIRVEHFDMHGASWGDVNNDGFPDLYLPIGGDAGSSTGKKNILFLNNGDSLVWVNRSEEFGLTDSLGRGRIGVWFDQDQDGYLDVLICNLDRNDGLFRTSLYVFDPNSGRYLYRPNTGIGNTSIYAATLIRDPVVDRVNLLNIGQLTPVAEIFNTRPWPFQQVFTVNQFGLRDVAVGDFNGDGLQDFFMATNWFSSEAVLKDDTTLQAFLYTRGGAIGYQDENRVSFKTEGKIRVEATIYPYKNNIKEYWWIGSSGRKPTTEVFELDPNDPANRGFLNCFLCVGPHIGYNVNAGRWEIFVNDPIDRARSSFKITSSTPITEVRTFNFTNATIKQPDRMMIATNSNIYTTRFNFLSNANNSTAAVSVVAGDFDNDMDLDLILACQGSAINYPNLYYENNGNGFFIQRDGFGASGSLEGKSGTITTVDYNNDGFLDIFVENGEGVLADDASPLCFNDGPYQLFMNKGNGNHWIMFDIMDEESNGNKLAYGTTAFVYANGKKQIRVKGSEIHAYGQNDPRLHFGLGPNERADSIMIIWPDGERFTHHCLKADSIYTIRKRGTILGNDRLVAVFDDFPIICRGSTPPQLPKTSSNGLQGTWSPVTVDNEEEKTYVFTADYHCTEPYIWQSDILDNGDVVIQGKTSACMGEQMTLSASPKGKYLWSTGDTTSAIMVQPFADTSYWVTVEIDNGCSASDTIFIQVKSLPDSPEMQSNAPVAVGETLLLRTASIDGASYHWSGPAGFISSERNPVLANVTFDNAGEYSLYITVDGCNSLPSRLDIEIRDTIGVSGKVKNELGAGLSFAQLLILGRDEFTLDTDGDGLFNLSLMEGGQYVIKPNIDLDLYNAKGITVSDIVAIEQHLSGTQTLPSPYKIIASDVSHTGNVTLDDMIYLEDLILLESNELPGKRWDFVPADYEFPNPQSPFPYPDSRNYDQITRLNDQDFIAMRIGDVNNSYFETSQPSCSDTLLLLVDDRNEDRQPIVSIPVRVKGYSNVSGWQWTVRWDAGKLQFNGISATNQPNIRTGGALTDEGMLSMLWHDNRQNGWTLPDSSILFNLDFSFKGQPDSVVTVKMDASLIPAEVVDFSQKLKCLAVKTSSSNIGTAVPVHRSSLQPKLIPNPFRNTTTLQFELKVASTCFISITDMAGRMYHQQVHEGASGNNTIVLGQGLPAGAYLLNIESNKQMQTIKMVVVK